MHKLKVVSPVSPQGPKIPKTPGLVSRYAKAAVLALAGTGVVGSGIYTGVTQYEQTQQVRELTDTVSRNQHSMRNMVTQIDSLNKELNSRITLDQVMDVVKNTTPSTVRVEGAEGLGSGVIILTSQGRYILTNGHVVQQNDIRKNEEQDSVYHIKLFNGSDYTNPIEFDAAPVILSDGQRACSSPDNHDLALLQIPPGVELPHSAGVVFRDLELDPVSIGEPVIAIGNPFGARDSVSFGIISHLDREAKGLNNNHHFQTDTPINPGNSGGGLFDMKGRLIGINTWTVRGGDGVGGSIRADEITKILKSWGVS